MATKSFLKSALLLSLLVTSSVAFSRQEVQKATPEEKAQRRTQWMQQSLALTDNQYKKLYSIILHFVQREDNPNTDNKAEMRAKDADIRAVLTRDQYLKYHEHIQEMP